MFLNGVIHTVMYTYYFVSLHTKDIWWKKYLTLMQMGQFVTMMSQAAVIMLNGDTTYPPRVTATYCAYIFSLLVLFAQFYVQSYTKNTGKAGTTYDKLKTGTAKTADKKKI